MVNDSTIGQGITVTVDARPRRATVDMDVVRPNVVADARFVGRHRELAELLDLLDPAPTLTGVNTAGAATGAVVSVVAGAPGVGKTALAQAAARAAVARGWFPGGAFAVDMQGYQSDSSQVVWPAQLYAGLLRRLGVERDQVPPTEFEQATAYHQILDQLAAAGRAVLLLIDNVGDADQVAGLLPRGVGGHRMLITTRDTLAWLPDACLLDVHKLDTDEAVALLTVGLRDGAARRRGARRSNQPEDGRVVADPAAAAQLVELCGGLPLAVQIVAAVLADEPDRPLADAIAGLADETIRLQVLDYGPGQRWSVRAAFELSYRRLDRATAELFALLAAAPGPDVGLGVAAALADRSEQATRVGLQTLWRAHLLDREGIGPRWRMHDLIRLYAGEQLTADERAAGFTRVLGYYRHTTGLAERRFTALPADADAVPAGFATAQEAMDWVLTERAGLVASVTRAVDAHPDVVIGLAADLGPFLDRARLLADWVIVASAAVQAGSKLSPNPIRRVIDNGMWRLMAALERRVAGRAGRADMKPPPRSGPPDRINAAAAWNSFGIALAAVRRFEEAITAHERAVEIFQETADRHGEGKVWNNPAPPR